jgi:hypothetical protein
LAFFLGGPSLTSPLKEVFFFVRVALTKLNFKEATDQTEQDEDNPPSPDMDQAMQE